MQRKGLVYNHGVLAGTLEETPDGFVFTYANEYLVAPDAQSISLTLPKRAEPYISKHLFAFFYGLLAEGTTRQLQCQHLKIDENDYFGLLLKTAHSDTIGSVTIVEVNEGEE